MIASCELARKRYVELLARYGEETVLGAINPSLALGSVPSLAGR